MGRGKVPLDAFPLANAKKIALVLDRLGERDRAAVEARRMASGFEKTQSGGTWAAGAGATASAGAVFGFFLGGGAGSAADGKRELTCPGGKLASRTCPGEGGCS